MKIRQLSLAVLQNVLKRDPSAYSEEFEALWRQYLSEVAIYKNQKSGQGEATAEHSSAQEREETKRLGDLANFVAHCGIHYEASRLAFGSDLAQLLEEGGVAMSPELRRRLTQALILSRSKGLLAGDALLETLFRLVRSVKRDRTLRRLAYEAIVREAKREWRRSRRRLLAAAASESDAAEAKIGLDTLIQSYKENLSLRRDVGLVDAIGRACCDPDRPKIARTAIYFFLGVDRPVAFEGDSDDDDDEDNEAGHDSAIARAARDEIDYHEHSKKTRKRERQVTRQKKRVAKLVRQAANGADGQSQPLFSAIELLSDPQLLCERMLTRLRAHKDKFETRILILELVSRLAAVHKLQLLPLYSYLQRYLDPKQRQVTKLLAIFVQACHELVPPDELRVLARHLADRFVSDRNAPEAMSLGINTLTNIVTRCPALLDEPEMLGFARDLAAYSKHRDKSVVISARSWINAVRHRFPLLLQKKDRGKFSDKHATPVKFGQSDPDTQVAGADLLQAYEAGTLSHDLAAAIKKKPLRNSILAEESDDDLIEEDDDDSIQDDEEEGGEENDDDIEGEENDDEVEGEDNDDEVEGEDNDDEIAGDDGPRAMIEATRILSAEDFARIRALKSKARELAMESNSHRSSSTMHGLVQPSDLEGYAAKRRATIEERRAKVEAGREEFQHRMHPGGKTNAEKKRTKNYLMVQKKAQRKSASRKRSRGAPKQQLLRDKRKRRRL